MKQSSLAYKGFLVSASFLSIFGVSLPVKAGTLTPVTIELALLHDASDSIPQPIFDELMNATNDIFNNSNFYEDFVSPLRYIDPSLENPSIAVGFYQFGTVQNDEGTHDVVIEQFAPWTVYNEKNQSGVDLRNVRKIGGFTPVGDAIDKVRKDLLENDYEGHKVINFSSDGFDNSSRLNPFLRAQQTYKDSITLNAIALPGEANLNEGIGSQKPYDEDFLRQLVSPYAVWGVEGKNFNEEVPAFLMLDYVTGEKTLADAFRLKIAQETFGFLPAPPPPPNDAPPNPPDDAPPDPLDRSNTESIPEPSSLLGLLTIGVWHLCKQYKKR
ncbi:MAG: VWA domain-containing protein [Crocosphaera sp.]